MPAHKKQQHSQVNWTDQNAARTYIFRCCLRTQKLTLLVGTEGCLSQDTAWLLLLVIPATNPHVCLAYGFGSVTKPLRCAGFRFCFCFFFTTTPRVPSLTAWGVLEAVVFKKKAKSHAAPQNGERVVPATLRVEPPPSPPLRTPEQSEPIGCAARVARGGFSLTDPPPSKRKRDQCIGGRLVRETVSRHPAPAQ